MIGNLKKLLYNNINEDTVTADISYLPGNFTSVKNMIASLMVFKKDWKIDVVESKDLNMYEIRFEDKLIIDIPMKHYEHFVKNVFDPKKSIDMDVSHMMNESLDSEMRVNLTELSIILNKQLFTKFPISGMVSNISVWKENFNYTGIKVPRGTIFNFENFQSQVEKFVESIKNIYADDLGQFQMLIDALNDGLPLNQFDGFNKFEYLLGGIYYSEYKKVKLIYEVSVNVAMIGSEVLIIDDEKLAQKFVEKFKDLKLVKTAVYPTSKFFDKNMFVELKGLIDAEV